MKNKGKDRRKINISRAGKSIFGRLPIIGSAIFFQLVLMLLLGAILNSYYFPVQVASDVFAVVAFVHLESRDMAAEMKLPWILLIFIFPLFGAVIYFILSENRLTPARKRLLLDIYDKSLIYYFPLLSKEEEETGKSVVERDESGVSLFLSKSSGLIPYENCATEYYPDGERFWESLCAELERAEKFIFMEYFIVEEGVMFDRILRILKRKAKEGVEVRLMYDDIGSVGTLPFDYPKKIEKMGISCRKFNRFVPLLTAVQNNRDHRKITVVDGRTGFIGGSNLADEYINAKVRFGQWKDSSVMIKGGAVKSLTLMFLQLWALQSKKTEDFSVYMEEEPEIFEEKGTVQPFGDGPKPFYDEEIGENLYLTLINQAKNSVWIMTPYFVTDKRITTAVESAAKRGVDVRIVTPHIPDKKTVYRQTKRNYSSFIRAGVKVYEYTPGFIHSKNVLCDGEAGVCGTINFDYRSFCHHYECAVVLRGTDSLGDMKKDFEETFAVSEEMTEKTARMSFFGRLLANIGIILTPLL